MKGRTTLWMLAAVVAMALYIGLVERKTHSTAKRQTQAAHWLPIPTDYSAPTPPGEPGPGWWKIRYVMGGSSGDTASDLTTWKTQIVGNPVHLVIP